MQLASAIRDIQPNIVQTHTFPAAVVGRAAAKLAGVPVIIDTLHNTYSWKQPKDLRIDGFLSRFTDRIVCVSQSVRDYAVDQNPRIPSDKYEVIYNGVDTKRYRPRDNREETLKRFGVDPGKLIVGSISRLVGQKRVADLIAAAPDILQQFPNAHFLIVGEGPTATRLIKGVHDQKLEESFTFTGNVQDSENVHSACDVFAQLAEREGFGLAMAEAMASGSAVVAAKTGAIPEIVQHGRNGLLHEVGDIKALTDNICTLLGDAGMRDALGTQAVQDIEENFNLETVPQKYRRLWYGLLSATA
jgi:glycosyltransferase involved in cell wall biosynthesis